MKRPDLLFFTLLGCVALLSSCKKEQHIDIVKAVHENNFDNPELMTEKGIMEYDSISFSDGSTAVHRLQWAPQNSLTEFRDPMGRVVATWAHASECMMQVMVRRYDDQGRLLRFLTFDCEASDVTDSIYGNWFGNGDSLYLAFRQRMEHWEDEAWDTAHYSRFDVEYNAEGHAVRVLRNQGASEIVAPVGYQLQVDIRPCQSFWVSDLDGGRFVFLVDQVPVQTDASDYVVKRYADMLPSMDLSFKAGNLVRILWHAEPSYSDAKAMTFTHEIIDEKQVYTRQEEGSLVAHRNIWQNGKLLYRQLIGVQGEVLESEESPRLPVDNDGNPLYEKDEMNPLRYSSCWQNVYDCILPDYSKKKRSV